MNNPFLQALGNRSFLFLWLSEVFSQVAMNMMNFILILISFAISNSNTAVSGLVLSFTIPAVLFGLLAGIFVDRWDKRRVLLVTNLIRFVLLLFLALAHNSLPVLYGLTFLVAVVTQFFIPAETPIIPLLVKRSQLLSANALFGMALYGSILFAYALSGPFLLLLGSTNALFLLAVFFLLASIFVLFIKVDAKADGVKAEVVKTSIQQEVKNALRVIFKLADVTHAFFLLILAQILIFIIAVIGPGFAKHILGISVEQFPVLFITPAAIGMAVGALIVTNYLYRFSRHKIATLGLFISAVTLFLMPYGSKVASRDFVHVINAYLPRIFGITILHVVVVLAFILGIANSLIFVPSNTLIQEQTSDQMRGKVYGALNSIASLASLLPVILVGSLADVFGVGTVLTILGFAVAFIGVVRLFLT